MPLDAFRIFRSPGDKKKEDPIQRRRAQVRRAQRTYQERKNAYAKSLEEALSRSKIREAELSQDNERLRSILEAVADKIPEELYMQIGVPPPLPPSLSKDFSSGLSPVNSDGTLEQSTTASYSSSHGSPPPAVERPLFSLQTSISARLGAFHIGGFDETAVGMEFVLFLEKPCMKHIHGDAETPHLANGHALSISNQILVVSDNEFTQPVPDPLLISHTLSKAILANLLNLSPQINNNGGIYSSSLSSNAAGVGDSSGNSGAIGTGTGTGTGTGGNIGLVIGSSGGSSSDDQDDHDREVTPIQAWDWLRRQNHFKQIQVHRLKNLLDELGRIAKCYGFGAMFPLREFERALYECIGSA